MFQRRCLSIALSLFVFLMLCDTERSSAQTVVVNNDLLFGNVFPSVPKRVLKTTGSSAAEFFITGTASAEVTIDFTLPTYMSSSGFNMQLIFYNSDAALDSSATPNQSSPPVDNLDPWSTITYRIGSSGLTIWLGGKAIPKLIQPQGSYLGDIVITVAYTGN
ncbi:MAG: hypothetical protein V3T31_01750 [candidate division Zixibacteria bacterium]